MEVCYYAIERVDGGVEIMGCFNGAEPAAEIARWHPARQAEVIASSTRKIDPNDIPQDRTFRNALKPDLTHDMGKCKTIHRDRMRRTRAPLLLSLDAEYQRADETGDAMHRSDVAARKQALRDVTAHPDIDKAKTPDELKAVWPKALQ